MKSFVPYTLLAAFAACGLAMGQSASTTPVGYVTETIKPNGFSLLGLTLHNPTVSAGVIASSSATSVTVTGADFSALLTAGATYVLELPDGTVQEIVSWSGANLNTPENISSFITPGSTTYKLRKASTISEVFGANNSVGLTPSTDGSVSAADVVLLVNAQGAFDSYFYFNDGSNAGWSDVNGEPAADKVISYPDGFFVQRKSGTALSLTISGEVKTVATSNVITPGYNYLSSVAPVGLSLAESNLNSFITPSTSDGSDADTVVVPQADGSFASYFYFNDGSVAGWSDVNGNPAADELLSSGFLVFNRGAAKPITISVPAYYSSL